MVHVLRLFPGEELLTAIEKFIKTKKIKAGWIVTCTGSLTEASIRYASKPEKIQLKGPFEIVSLVGTLT